jgi:hypothetical protein
MASEQATRKLDCISRPAHPSPIMAYVSISRKWGGNEAARQCTELSDLEAKAVDNCTHA